MLLLALLLATFPSNSRTSWMRPEAFHLAVGMSRSAALRELKVLGWKTTGKDPDRRVIEYSDDKTVTLIFKKNRLEAIRFELFVLLTDWKSVYDEEKSYLLKSYGAPTNRVKGTNIVLYDHQLPNVMEVISNDRQSDAGKRGLALLAVRYFDPVPIHPLETRDAPVTEQSQ